MYVEDARVLDDKSKKAFLSEVKIWARLAHPHTLRLFGACLDTSRPFMVSEYCKFGNICEYLARISSPPRSLLVRMVDDVASGMAYLHRNRIIHGDLKGANILVSNDHRALLADFGISKVLDEDFTTRSHQSRTGSLRGTLRWMAPECLYGDSRVTMASDIYSFAMTAWEIYSGQVPFADISERVLAIAVVEQKRRPKCPARLTGQGSIWTLIQSCWDARPSVRPDFENIRIVTKRLSSNKSGEYVGAKNIHLGINSC
ncbi:kinase-like protein [Stereum hirsutum FP-91666 SS1]|uniref:kinase-like protein n=1 Tax=Stereum hirsutum (strain FP-91666) TaxID=721885 RepID=UPI0004449EBE|nr:kinase-like protein [Stereum hirsutum FP-91666 SS1]EIM81951.1 kinase-like protein [Stereum hirsutum FP-91666 SS1]